ncbi:MAG: hypothetical protein V1720_04665 [bacterium]
MVELLHGWIRRWGIKIGIYVSYGFSADCDLPAAKRLLRAANCKLAIVGMQKLSTGLI